MKYVLVFVVVLIAYSYWRNQQRARPAAPPAARPSAPPQDMVACAQCGLHVPRAEALPGPEGQSYCSDAHRLLGPR